MSGEASLDRRRFLQGTPVASGAVLLKSAANAQRIHYD
jgi:hypothetical protein